MNGVRGNQEFVRVDEHVLRPATTADKAWLDILRRKAYQDLFDATWGGWDEFRHQRRFSAFWEAGNISIVSINGQPAGSVQLFISKNIVEIGEIQVLPQFQNLGIDTNIISKCLGFEEAGRSETHLFMVYPL